MESESQISVIVVEDDPSWQQIYEEVLGSEGAGYSVTVADSRDDAVVKLRQRYFDVAIVDLKLPEKSGDEEDTFEHGVEVLDYISKLRPRPRVLVSTGYATFPVDVARAIDKVGSDLEVFQKEEVEDALLESVRRLAAAKWVEEGVWKVGGALTSIAVDLNGILTATLERAIELTGARIGHILFPVGDELRIFIGTGKEPEGFRVPIANSVTGKAINTGEPVNIPNIKNEELYFPVKGGGMNSELAIPLLEDSKAVGVINLESDKLGAFDKPQQDIAKVIADLVVVTLRNEKRRREFEATSRLLSEVLNSAEVQRSILEIGAEQLGAQIGSLLLKKGEDELEVAASYPKDLSNAPQVGTKYKINDCVSGLAVVQRRVINVEDVTEKPYCDVYKPLGKDMKSEIVAVLEVEGEVIGVLNFESPEVAEFTEYDESLLSALAKQAAIALEKTRLHDELREAKKHERLALIGELSGDVVHRMNTPFSAIRANVQLIEENYPDILDGAPDLYARLMKIQGIAERAMDLVEDMKAKAREHKWESVNVQSMLNIALSGVDIPADICINLEVEKDLPDVKASKKLSTVFQNLLFNAVDAMLKSRCPTCMQFIHDAEIAGALGADECVPTVGEKVLTIVARKVEDDRQAQVEVIVEDTGCGIPPGWNEELNQSYFTTSQDRNSAHGLGLWYSTIYVEALGGSLTLQSGKDGVGTKAIVCLPAI